MMQVVRHQAFSFHSADLNQNKITPPVSRQVRLLQVAFISLAATNLFIVTSAVSFYWLAHN